ncbi:MAG: hypothetical protein U0791_24975 [Gemmataceae bacterium]
MPGNEPIRPNSHPWPVYEAIRGFLVGALLGGIGAVIALLKSSSITGLEGGGDSLEGLPCCLLFSGGAGALFGGWWIGRMGYRAARSSRSE